MKPELHTCRLHATHAGITALHFVTCNHSTLLSQGRDGAIKQWDVSAEGTLSRVPLQVIETGSYNFCRMAVYVPEGPATNLLHQQASPSSPEDMSDNSHAEAIKPQHKIDALAAMSDMANCNQLRTELASSICSEEDTTVETANAALVAIAGHDPAVLELWNLQTGAPMKQLHQPEGVKHGMCMAVQLFNQPARHTLYALVGYEDGEVAVWDVFQGNLLISKHLHDEPVMAVAIDATGEGGICAAADNKVHCFSLDLPAQQVTLKATLEVKQQGIADICIRQDQRLFATAGWDGKIRVFHYKKLKTLAVLQYHKKGLTALVLDSRAQRLVSASRDGNIALWSVFQSDSI
ncbi:TPA: Guanine nucleotide binding protein (G protein), beta polypeptide 1-like, variant 7 [Trebouxia sp. C0004]